MFSFLVLFSGRTVAQTNSSQSDPVFLPLPVMMDWSESINPLAQKKLVADRYKIQAGTKSFKLQFSNQAPAFLGGKQFQGLPGGYRLADFALSRKWGTVYGFRSVGYISRMMRPESARNLAGAALELPKSLFGTSLSGYLFHATPREQARSSGSNPLAASAGSQIGLTLGRELRKGTGLQVEWTQTHYSKPSSPSGSRVALAGLARRGLWIKFDSIVSKTDLNFTVVNRDEGLANPAVPSYGPAKRTLRLDVRRKLRQHQFQYSSQFADQRPLPVMHLASTNVREQTLRWTFAPRRLPQISASQTWSRQSVAHRLEQEGTFRLSLSKTIRRLNASVALLRGTRTDARSSRSLWERTALTGDASVEIRKETRIHLRYETSGLSQRIISQLLSTSSFQIDTRVGLWKNKLSLAPVLDYRRQGGSLPDYNLSMIRIVLTTVVTLPRRFPGNDLLIHFGSQRLKSAGCADSRSNELTVRWNFKQL